MKIVNICKAEPYSNDPGGIEGVTIVVDNNLPSNFHRLPLDEIATYYDNQAQLIFDGLCGSLPGATLDRLLGKMLAYKASHFRVPSWKDGDA